jgi:hypothetical protein
MATEDPEAALPFRDRPARPAVAVPAPLAAAVALAVAAGLAAGALSSAAPALRLLRAIFFGSAFGYLGVSLLDFWEHFRLEKVATGRLLAATVIPVGETINHALTTAVIVLLFALARPLPPSLALRDWFTLAAPALFLALGWRDEIVYHRRRAVHREDMMHTVAHLAAGVMMCTFLTQRLVGG